MNGVNLCMKIARGNTRKLLKKVNNIQDLVSEAIGLHFDDQDRNGFEKAQKLLQKAFDLCIEITGEYERIEP